MLCLLCCTASFKEVFAETIDALNLPTQEYVLDNGLKLIVREDHRAPIVISQIWYKVGSSYESSGTTGISHALEHMMFKGTARFPAGQFSKLIAENGGNQNAFTSYDYTAFYQQIDPRKLEICFELEADRMRNLSLSAAEFAKEINVVQEERRLRIEDNPEALAKERFFAAAYLNNPHQHPVIGWMSDVLSLKIEDLRKWYQTWYAPNNAILVVVGDVKPDEILALAKKYFGNIPRADIPKIKLHREVPPLGEKRIEVKLPAATPYLFMGYQTPNIATAEESWEPYALSVLLMALDGGNSSRFTQHLIRGNAVAADISTWYNPFQLFPGLITFFGTPASTHTLEDLEQGFQNEIEALKTQLIQEKELQRIKTQVIAEHIYAKDSLAAQANELGSFEAANLSWRLTDAYVEQIQAITAKQVQSVAIKYLRPERKTVAYLIPSTQNLTTER